MEGNHANTSYVECAQTGPHSECYASVITVPGYGIVGSWNGGVIRTIGCFGCGRIGHIGRRTADASR